MYTLKIKVTKEILQKSAMCGTISEAGKMDTSAVGSNCALALAVREIFPNAWVSREYIASDGDRKKSLPINLPWSMRSFIKRFDMSSSWQRRQMPEQEFDLPIPDEVIESINIDEIKQMLETVPHLELIEN